jgi:hypothetical protein
METKHTPGPWLIENREGVDGFTDLVVRFPGYDGTANGRPKAIDPFSIATINTAYFGDTEDLEAQANARLIAAAPELLEALRALLNWDGKPATDIANARAAILKATGAAC